MQMYDPYIDSTSAPLETPSIYFIGTNHDLFKGYNFPNNSVVIDPWRYVVLNDKNIKLISIGNTK